MAQYDAIIIGSGPNGLAAAVQLQKKGLQTLIIEKAEIAGGATRSSELTLPGFHHDMGSAIHPLAYDSPFFKELDLSDHGLEWVFPKIAFAHPFEDGDAYGGYKDILTTAEQLGKDKASYIDLFSDMTDRWDDIAPDLLSPISLPSRPFKLVKFGLLAIQSAKFFANTYLKEEKSRIFYYGAAAHSILPLNKIGTSSFGLVLMILAHKNGWPFPKGGAKKINEALLSYYKSIGGKIELGTCVSHMNDMPSAKAYVFNLTPKQLLQIGGTNLSRLYRYRLGKYKYGAGIFKIDWALQEPVPWINEKCRHAGTIHLGYSREEIESSEQGIYENVVSEKPYVLIAQHSLFDDSRAPEGKHTLWAYCHMPNGSEVDATKYIEDQIEKAAPGFRDIILKRTTHTSSQMEAWNPNLVGGDVNGGKQHMGQMFTRPIASFNPYKTSNNKIFIASASTPPGGGVHGMAGFNAANAVIKEHFS